MYDLARGSQSYHLLGWCNGISVAAERAFVGFSRIRSSKLSEGGAWVRRARRRLPSRIAQFDLRAGAPTKQAKTGEPDGAEIFSLRDCQS